MTPAPAARACEASSRPPALMLQSPGWHEGYSLIDTGAGRKLERFGERTLVRPEPLALWAPSLSHDIWKSADAVFDVTTSEEDDNGRWQRGAGLEDTWTIRRGKLTCICRLTSFRHVGVFPEQAPHWDMIAQTIAARRDRAQPFRMLNLFGYTGVASLVAAAAGAEVTHVDASKKAIGWAKENQALSGLDQRTVRWICDDATKFAAREVRRGARYDGIILDPPKFGRGPGNEIWNLTDDLPLIMRYCAELLTPESAFLILTAYAVRLSYLSLYELLRDAAAGIGGHIDAGELLLRDKAGRCVPTSLYARWTGSPA